MLKRPIILPTHLLRPLHTRRAMSSFNRLIRFLPKGSNTPVIGEPVESELDVGLASYESKPIEVDLYSGTSVLDAGSKTGQKATVERLLSPLAKHEVGTIRCIGLNVSCPSMCSSL